MKTNARIEGRLLYLCILLCFCIWYLNDIVFLSKIFIDKNIFEIKFKAINSYRILLNSLSFSCPLENGRIILSPVPHF